MSSRAEGIYYAAVGAQVDDADSNDLTGELGLPLGDPGWLHLAVGSSTATLSSVQVDTTVATVYAGFDTESLGFEAGYAYRKDADSFHQDDLRGALTVRLSRVSFGLDLFHRAAEDETVMSIERRRLDPLAIRIVESIEGTGIGAHIGVNATERLYLFGSGMAFDYDSDIDGPAFLQRFPRLNLRLSGVTRDEAYLDNTARIGASYDIEGWALTGTYTRDEELNSGEITHTAELSIDIPIGESWELSPWIGVSSNAVDGDIAFGGARVGVFW